MSLYVIGALIASVLLFTIEVLRYGGARPADFADLRRISDRHAVHVDRDSRLWNAVEEHAFCASSSVVASRPILAGIGSRGEGRQNARPGACAFMKQRALVFFIRRVDPVVVEAEADEQTVHIKLALE